jgi:hypothetical protein
LKWISLNSPKKSNSGNLNHQSTKQSMKGRMNCAKKTFTHSVLSLFTSRTASTSNYKKIHQVSLF